MSFFNRIFLKGLITILPLFLTIYLLIWMITVIESSLSRAFTALFPVEIYIPGLGIVCTILIIVAVGLLVDTYLAQKAFAKMGGMLDRVPFIKVIYRPLRDVMNLFSTKLGGDSKRVVFVTLPGSAHRCIGLVTRESFDDLPKGLNPAGSVAVYIPLSYAMGGITIIADRSDLIPVDLKVDQAMKLAITGWVKASPRS